ncbi:MAG: DNA gyrase subunit A, partial [Bdellovibrionales bacterium]|nr:DNA gyrase subunit A [Bdellovibrionales bacterium]
DVGEIYKIITEELDDIRSRFGTPRRTKIESSGEELEDEDLIANEEMVVSMTFGGYIKRIPIDEYRVQKRGGKGLKGAGSREEDFVWRIFTADTLTTMLVFSDRGKVYWQKVHKLPQGSRTTKGKAINNVVNFSSGERVRAILPVEKFIDDNFVVLLTEKGIIKKTQLSSFSRPRPSGIIALTTDLEDNVIDAKISDGKNDVFIVTKEGMSIRFDEGDVRAMGRSARGVKGITLGKEDCVIGMEVIEKECNETILIVTEGGYGKRTAIPEYRVQSRGGVGVITQKITDKVGPVVAARSIKDEEEIIITTNEGQAIRMKATDISVLGRNTQGVKLINLKDGEYVTGLALVSEDDQEEAE